MSATLPECIEAQAIHDAIYRTYDGGAGCCWHVMLDDGNVQDCFIAPCVMRALEEKHQLCINLSKPYAAMSMTQRKKLHEGGYRKHFAT